MDSNTLPIFDAVGIGAGPIHLSLVLLLDEMLPPAFRRVLFLEKQSVTAWHPGMLLPHTVLQTSFLKDLITIYNPTSQYSFLNYCHKMGTLHDFVNLRSFYPPRADFSNYMRWVSEQFKHWIRHESQALSVRPITDDAGHVDTLEIAWENLQTGQLQRARTRNLSIAAGRIPKIPTCMAKLESPNVIHSSHFSTHIDRLRAIDRPQRVLIVGGGQSAAEILRWFLDTRPQDEVTMVLSKFALSPVDNTHFVNTYFSPDLEDYVNGLPDVPRADLVEKMQPTDYAVANPELIALLYARMYELKVNGIDHVRMLNSTRVEDARNLGTAMQVDVRHKYTGALTQHMVDTAIMATGYSPNVPVNLDELEPYVLRDQKGRYAQNRNYSIRTKEGFRPQIMLQGYGEHNFGLTEGALSILPYRAARVARSFCENLATYGPADAERKHEPLASAPGD